MPQLVKDSLRYSDLGFEPEKINLIDLLTDATVQTEGLIPGQTPLRITNDTMRNWGTIQGVPIDKEAIIPPERRNFFFVKPDQVNKVIRKQWQNYINKPEKYGLTEDSTLKEVVEVFDQENPQNKMNLLQQQGVNMFDKIKDLREKFDLSKLFAATEAHADEPYADLGFELESDLGFEPEFKEVEMDKLTIKEKNYIKSAGKALFTGIAKTISQAPQVAAETMKYLGPKLQYVKPKFLDISTPLGAKMIEIGNKLQAKNREYVAKAFPEAQDKYDQVFEDIGAGGVSLGAALGISAIAGPAAGGVAFGVHQKIASYSEAKEKGKDEYSAEVISSVLGLVEGGLEFWGLDKLISSSGKVLKRAFKGMASEAIQEASQSIGEGFIKMATGLREFKGQSSLIDLVTEALYSGAIGAVIGGPGSIAVSISQRGAIKDAFKETGLEDKDAGDMADIAMAKGMDDVVNEIEKIAIGPDEPITTEKDLPPVMTDAEGKVIPLEVKPKTLELKGEYVDAVVAPSAKEPGRWQSTYIQKDGTPSGDSIRDTFEEAVEEARQTTGVLTEEQEAAGKELEIKPKLNKPADVQEEITEQDTADLTVVREMSANWEAGGKLIEGDPTKSTQRKIRAPSTFPIELQNIGLTHKHMNTVFKNILDTKKPLTEKQQQTKNLLLGWYRDVAKGALDETGLSESETAEAIREANQDEPVSQQDLWEEEKPGYGVPEGIDMDDEGGKVHGLSKSVETQAIEEGLVRELKDLPTYKTRNMDEVAERASTFINENYDLAMKIALGEAAEQGDIRSQELYTALRIKALLEGDVDTIERLALSKTAVSLATELGQRIKAYDARLSFDPVSTIQEVVKDREDAKSDMKKDKKISELTKQLEDAETKIKELDARIVAKKNLGTKKFGSKNKIFTEEKLEDARKRLKSKLSGLHSGVDPTAVIELTEIGGFYFEGGVRTFSEWSKTLINEFGNSIKPHLRKVWKAMRKEYSKQAIEISKGKIGKMAEEGEPFPKQFVVQQIAEELVEFGTLGRNDLVQQVMEILQESYPDISFRETSDLISGYGKYSKLSDEAVKVILRDIKGQLQQVSKLEDMQAGQAPKKTGVERREASDEERRLIKLVEQAKRKYNIKTTDPSTQLKNALDSYKTGLKNQIKDLEKQIKERTKIVKTRTALQLDKEAKILLEKKQALREVFDSIFGRPELSLKQRIRMAEAALEKSIATYERKISEGDISPITKKKTPVSTPQLEKMRIRHETLKKQLNDLREQVKPKKTPQEIALQSLKTRLANETKRLEDRIDKIDFEKRQKKEIKLDAEASKLKWERDRVKAAFNAAKEVKEGITKDEISKIVTLAKDATDAQKKVLDKDDWTADNAEDVENYFYKKNEFEEYVENLKAKTKVDTVNKFIDFFRANILFSPRILRNSFLYQIVPGVERAITKRITTGAFSDSDLKSTLVEKLLAKISGIKPSAKNMDFIKRQVAMTIRIYHKTGIDISRQEKMDSPAKIYGEKVRKFAGKSLLDKIGKIISLGPKWMAGGTDMLFASVGRADTSIMMSKEIAKIEALQGKLPEGVTESQRADQLLKDSYSFSPQDKRADAIREAGIMDAHMMNNTQPGWWSDKVIEFRRMLSIGKLNFGKMFVPFAKIANVVAAEGVKTATGYGIVKSVFDINAAAKSPDRAKKMRAATTNLIRYVGLTGAALLLASLFDDDDYIGTYNTIGRKEYELAKAKNAGTNYVRIAGRWVPLRYLPMVNIPISAIMTARQAKLKGDNPIAGYLVGMMGQIMDTPGIKETGTITSRIGYALKSNNLEKIAKSMKLDWEGLSKWAKVRMIPSVISYDVWNHLYPPDKRYDFMGREIEKAGAFKEDKSNEITVEMSRLSNTKFFPTISDPSGKYAIALEKELGEEAYVELLSEFKMNYAEEVLRIINHRKYKRSSDEDKKKMIDGARKDEILKKIRNEYERSLPKTATR